MIRGDNPGRRDVKIVVESPSTARNTTYGDTAAVWSTFATVYGSEMKPPASSESHEADQQVAVQVSKYKIPYLQGLTEKMRFNIGGDYKYVKGIELWDRRKFMAVTTEKRDNG